MVAAHERSEAALDKTADEYDEKALGNAVFLALDSNNDFELSRAEFETGLKILDALRSQEYPGLREAESAQLSIGDKSEENDQFEIMDSDEDGVLSLAEFKVIVGSLK